MNVILIDLFCAILAVAGIAVALRGAGKDRHGPGGSHPGPATYVSRIAGVMMVAFALALGGMVTGLSIANG